MPLFQKLKRLFSKRRETLTPSFRAYIGNQRFGRDRRAGKTLSAYQAPTTRTERREQRWKGRIKSIGLVLLGVLSVGGIIGILFFSPLLQVQKIEVIGESETLNEQKVVQTGLEAYLQKNMLLVPGHGLEQQLLKDFPYLKTIEIDKVPFHSLKAKVTAYPHAANIEVLQEGKDSQYFVVNSGGMVAIESNTEEGLPWIQLDATGLEIPEKIGVHETLISEELLSSFLETKNEFEAKFNIEVTEMSYLKRARELHLKTERDFWVWLDIQKPMDMQLLKLKRSMSDLNIYEAPLIYIDLRISGQNGEKVIYKTSD